MQKLLTLIIAGAILYMVFRHNLNDVKAPPPPPEKNDASSSAPEASGNFVEKTISNVLINVLKTDQGRMFFENIIKPTNTPIAGSDQGFKINNDNLIESMFDIKTFGDGISGPATCGHIVTVNYKILTPNNMVIREDTVTYSLGSGKIGPGVDAVIVGMKTGQTRHAIISSKYTDTIQNTATNDDVFKLNVLLKESMPHNFINDSVKIFDDEMTYKLPLLCGNKAVYHAKITELSTGKIIYNSKNSGKKINMQIGNLTYPLIFSHSLHNKIPIGIRTVISPGKFFKSFINDFSTIFPDTKLPENEFFMLELYDFENTLPNSSNNLSMQK